MHRSPRVIAGALVALALFTVAVPLVGQQESCLLRATNPGTTAFGPEAASLPVDRLSDLLVLGPGVSGLDDGQLSVRNAGGDGNALYIDGVPVIPGLRGFQSPSLGGSYFNPSVPGIGVGTNAYQQLSLTAGLTPVDLGNARGGVIEVETSPCAVTEAPRALVLRAGLASDAMFGTSNGLGFNRLTASGMGRFGRVEVGGAAVVEGQKSARLGLGQNDSPIYIEDGIDTTVTVTDGTTDFVVPISRLLASDGIRIPASTSTNYSLSGQVAYDLGSHHRVRLSGLASQRQARLFSYENLYNPRQTFGSRDWSQVLTGSWFGDLMRSNRLTLTGEAHLSLQWDHATDAPLSDAGEEDSRDPSLGLLLSPLDFRFAQSNFPVNDQLVQNFRTNSGRLSPYDLTNTTQYQLFDQYRNNAYGVRGFSEGGGPVGTLALYDEKRVVAKGGLTARVGDRHRLRAGMETTRYDVSVYSSRMTSQVFAEAFVESPTATAAYGEYRLMLPEITVTGGFRFDRFKSGASRPEFPRISSLGVDPENPTAGFIADKAHSRLSPRIAAVAAASPRLRVAGGYTSLTQIPDFMALFAGINTDLSTTNTAHIYGTDLNLQRTGIAEVGADFLLDSSTTISGVAWNRGDQDLIRVVLSSEVDPFRGTNVDIRRYRNAIDASATGIDLRVTRQLGERGQAWLSYGYVSPDEEVQNLSREHTVSAAVSYETGGESNLLGGILRSTGVYGTFRLASGTRYTRCPVDNPDDAGVLSGELCSRQLGGDFNGAKLPALKLLDLRVTRGFNLGGAELVAFADARNLLNLRTVARVFAQTGTTRNSRERDRARDAALFDWSSEAEVNGVLQPDQSVDLSFGGATNPRAACGSWTETNGVGSAPNCVYLIEAEARFGNGDHIFTVAEQTRAFDAYYYVSRGEQNFTAPGRRVRLGVEVRF